MIIPTRHFVIMRLISDLDRVTFLGRLLFSCCSARSATFAHVSSAAVWMSGSVEVAEINNCCIDCGSLGTDTRTGESLSCFLLGKLQTF